ncbi:hypothetical protein [Candidatus Neomicrothrix sp.]|nr:hypothetical protein [Candidatus Microthrix sp.]
MPSKRARVARTLVAIDLDLDLRCGELGCAFRPFSLEVVMAVASCSVGRMGLVLGGGGAAGVGFQENRHLGACDLGVG